MPQESFLGWNMVWSWESFRMKDIYARPVLYCFLGMSSFLVFVLFLSLLWLLAEPGAWAGWTFVQIQYGQAYGEECLNHKHALDHFHTKKEREVKCNIPPRGRGLWDPSFYGTHREWLKLWFCNNLLQFWLPHSQSFPWTTSGIQPEALCQAMMINHQKI